MGWLRRRTGLERIALLAVVATVVAIGVTAFGVFDASKAEVAATVTEQCRPLAAIDLGDPAGIMRRDERALRDAAGHAARGMRDLLKSTGGDVRKDLGLLRAGLQDAADPYGQDTLEASANRLFGVSMIAQRLGARCPTPISAADAKTVDERLDRARARP